MIKTLAKALLLFVLCSTLVFTRDAIAEDFTLNLPAARELRHIAETYHLLDAVAEKIWPGWNDYRRYPFLLCFDNGLRLLIGHSNPPPPFQQIAGLALEEKKVFADTSQVIELPIPKAYNGGGNVSTFGSDATGQPLTVVNIFLRSLTENVPPANNSDRQIMIYLHELFHCFQENNFRIGTRSSLEINSDVTFALYSALEGMALDKAFHEPQDGPAREYLRDFLRARALKYSVLTPSERLQGATDELMEGTAMYAQARALALLNADYLPALTQQEDPFFHNFQDAKELFEDYCEELRSDSQELLEGTMKCYSYGCFQALLLQRFFPGWQEPFGREPRQLDLELKRRLLPRTALAQRDRRLRTLYPFAALQKRARREIGARNQAYRLVTSRKGQVYVINFVPIQSTISPRGRQIRYFVGLNWIFPQGLAPIRLNEVEISEIKVPAEIIHFRYLRVVDTTAKRGGKPYTLEFEKQDEGGAYIQAKITTPLFTLRAPKVQIKATPQRIKFTVLARVTEKNKSS